LRVRAQLGPTSGTADELSQSNVWGKTPPRLDLTVTLEGRPRQLANGADLGQFARREVDALLLCVRALANGGELVGHLPHRLGQLGKLAGDEGRVLSLRHLHGRSLRRGVKA
jgi:hypothetical protein